MVPDVAGGSGAAAPLYTDFCFVLLGWSALQDVARNAPKIERGTTRLEPTKLLALREGGLFSYHFLSSIAFWVVCGVPPCVTLEPFYYTVECPV